MHAKDTCGSAHIIHDLDRRADCGSCYRQLTVDSTGDASWHSSDAVRTIRAPQGTDLEIWRRAQAITSGSDPGMPVFALAAPSIARELFSRVTTSAYFPFLAAQKPAGTIEGRLSNLDTAITAGA